MVFPGVIAVADPGRVKGLAVALFPSAGLGTGIGRGWVVVLRLVLARAHCPPRPRAHHIVEPPALAPCLLAPKVPRRTHRPFRRLPMVAQLVRTMTRRRRPNRNALLLARPTLPHQTQLFHPSPQPQTTLSASSGQLSRQTPNPNQPNPIRESNNKTKNKHHKNSNPPPPTPTPTSTPTPSLTPTPTPTPTKGPLFSFVFLGQEKGDP